VPTSTGTMPVTRVPGSALSESIVIAVAVMVARVAAGMAPVAPYHSRVTYETDPRVDMYIDALPGWQQAICREVREIAHEADAEVAETIKRTVQPYFVLEGNVCALLATKDHVNVFLYDPTVSDPAGIITAGHGNATGRQIAIYEGDAINRSALTAMLREIIANNRAGGWRKLTR
jgi:hypothetical protein